MIIKIQRSQEPKGMVLIYEETAEYWWQGIPDPSLDKWLGDRQKVFAEAHLEGSVFIVDHEAPWQDW